MRTSQTNAAGSWAKRWLSRKSCLTIGIGLASFCLTSALLFTSATARGQSAVQVNGVDVTAGADEESSGSTAPYVIFSNVGSADDPYRNTFFPTAIVGKQVEDMTEQWGAVRFVPKVDVQATTLEAAVQYVGGTRSVQLSIYDSNGLFGLPGAALPGAQGKTTDVPDKGDCCQLATVTLPQPVTLSANTIYWIVANAGDKHFNGVWQVSHLGESANIVVPRPWVLAFSAWPAARVSGAKLQTLGPVSEEEQFSVSRLANAAVGRAKIFSNINPVFLQPYNPGVGLLLVGNDVTGYSETRLALPFTPKSDVQATTLKAAIAHDLGYPTIIDLGIYSDNGGLPDEPLPGGVITSTNLPLSGQCCDFASVRLPGRGATLSGGVRYWLVASPNADAENFMGLWQTSTNNTWAVLKPEQSSLWTAFTGEWLAAQITGRNN